jgi:hypothetical protein
VACQFLPVSRAAACVEIGDRCAGAERQIRDPAGDQLVLAGLDHADCDVGIAPQQIVDLVGRHEFDLDVRLLAAKAGKDRGQHIGRDHLAGGDAHRAGNGIGRAEG